jgi:hypothetical protein
MSGTDIALPNILTEKEGKLNYRYTIIGMASRKDAISIVV